ncbi:hypothetical protein ABT09_00915 [bacterium SCN 57-13]|nr:MAG: hypothetical protein ABT09_00915 [bacterium SCN 57-13]
MIGWYVLPPTTLELPTQHRRHVEVFGSDAPGFNRLVLAGIDQVQGSAPDGGGYFIGIKAKPTESPIGYPLTLCGRRLLDPPRRTSYCSGASYAAFIEGLGLWMAKERVVWSPPSDFETSPFANVSFERPVLTAEQVETLRMQELDGGRRDDGVKFWGNWNADGFGNQMALVQYSGMGTRIKPSEARPGDFLNISWKSGIGHSTVFLGWSLTKDGEKAVRYWSSQTGTNGLGDAVALLSKISSICLVRVTHPERVLSIRSSAPVQPKVLGDAIDW